MPKPNLPGHIVFAFSFVDDAKGRFYHIAYDEEGDIYKGNSQLAGCIYKMMHDYPFLVEPILFAAQKAAEELSEPFNKILK